MSKNHPHDNIYSILGKLDALKPTPEEKRFALVKEIRESVEAKGSILSGVDAVQAKLAKQFAESQVEEKAVSKAQQKFMGMVHAAQKGEKAASPAVAKVAKSMGKKDAQDFAATKHKGLPAHVAEGSETGIGSKLPKSDIETFGLQKGRPYKINPPQDFKPGDRKRAVQQLIPTQDKKDHIRSRLGKHVAPVLPEQGVVESNDSVLPLLKKVYNNIFQNAAKGIDMTDYIADDLDELYDAVMANGNPAVLKGYKMLRATIDKSSDEQAAAAAKAFTLLKKAASVREGVEEATMSRAAKGYEKYGKKGMEALAQAGRDGASEKELDSIRDKHDQYNESTNCLECGMAEGTCSHMAEGEITKTEKGMRHRGTYGTEYQGDHDAEDDEQYKADKGIRKRGRPAKGTPKKVAPATGEKKGRGRPAKAKAPTYSAANDPFGRVPSKAPASKIKGTKHSLAESMQRVIEGVNFKRMAEDYNMTLDEMMDCMERDIAEYKMTGQMTEALRDFMEIHTHSKKQMADEAVNVAVPAALRKQQGGDWKAKTSDVLDPKPDTLSHSSNIQKRADALGFNDANPLAMPKSSIEEELDELAKLAGLNMESVDKEKFAALAEPKDKITYADKIAGAKKSDVDEEATDEGNAFGKAVRDAKADGVQPGEKVTVGGKEYAVKEARELVQMLKIAGMDTKQLEEAINAAVNEFAPVVAALGRAAGAAVGGAARAIGGAMSDVGDDEVAEGRMGEIDALYQEWVNSEDAPFDSDSGDQNAVLEKAMRFLNGRVRPEQIEDIADMFANHWHGGQGVMGEEEELANAPDEKYMSIKASTLNPGEGDFGEKNMYGGPGDNPMTQRPLRPALPVRNESVVKLEAKLAAEYDSIKKATK